ncbi:unnamed protein product [Moneuplotes crassus]|uniref:Uncharacterized protein n=1 Tax=Euplotes crassus TaxID=5936 RepID=A0AAD1XET2_EUPCR|nr:unnamed protein product [Moneuplotes crassus]
MKVNSYKMWLCTPNNIAWPSYDIKELVTSTKLNFYMFPSAFLINFTICNWST